MTLEEQAIMLSLDKKQLYRRMREAVSVMSDWLQPHFAVKATRFDFEGKRLVGADGYILQWNTRKHPACPVSYDNQQCSVGVCTVTRTA